MRRRPLGRYPDDVLRCIAWPRVALAASLVALITGVALPLALAGSGAAVKGMVVDASQVVGALLAAALVSARPRWTHAWVTFFASIFLAGALTAALGALA